MQRLFEHGRPLRLAGDLAGRHGGRLSRHRRGRARPGRGHRALDAGLSRRCARRSSPSIIGEGGSGGAVAIATANKVFMLEHAIYSVISPEGCASILWHKADKAADAAAAMKITAQDLLELKVIDGIIAEPVGGAHRAPASRHSMPRAIRSSARCAISSDTRRRSEALAAREISPDRTAGDRRERQPPRSVSARPGGWFNRDRCAITSRDRT